MRGKKKRMMWSEQSCKIPDLSNTGTKTKDAGDFWVLPFCVQLLSCTAERAVCTGTEASVPYRL